MKVGADHIVRIDCELRVKDGEVIESSKKSGPVEYRHGTGKMLAALESRLLGMDVGEQKKGTIPASEAFGTLDQQPKMSIPRASFPKDVKPEVGGRFGANGPGGTPVTLEVETVSDEQVVARVVHPLAGKDLEFDVKVLAVRPPPPPVPSKPPTPVASEDLLELDPDSER